MRPPTALVHEFVEFIPEDVREGTVYVCLSYATVVHKCCCGCGHEVVTPLSPTDWSLIFDGVSISLNPSIGNWGFSCQSHYWIQRNRVRWAGRWSQEEVEAGRAADSLSKAEYYKETRPESDALPAGKPVLAADESSTPRISEPRLRRSWWRRLFACLWGAS